MSSHLAWTLLRMISINHTPCHYGNLVSMATRVKPLLFTPWKSQDGLLMFTSSSEQQERNKQQGQNGQRVKMGQESRWAFVTYPLKESKWDKGHYELLLFTPWQSQPNSEQQGQNGLLLFTPWLSQTNSEQQERNKQQGQNGPRVKMGFCYLPPERVKMGQRSLRAAVVYPLTEWN